MKKFISVFLCLLISLSGTIYCFADEKENNTTAPFEDFSKSSILMCADTGDIIYENNAYEIEQELRHNFPKLNLTVLIGSVRDSCRIERVFEEYKPQIVYHAAAHKHVPLMEHSGCEAIKNNVLGTYNTADMAEKYGTAKFILISTDKAVNPTNIMGASKRMCEMIVQCRTYAWRHP